MGPYGLVRACPSEYYTFSFLLLSFFFSLVKSLHVIMYKVLKPNKAVKKKKKKTGPLSLVSYNP